jgi:hypothetical protein
VLGLRSALSIECTWPGPALPLHCIEWFAELPASALNGSAGSGHLMLNASIVCGMGGCVRHVSLGMSFERSSSRKSTKTVHINSSQLYALNRIVEMLS